MSSLFLTDVEKIEAADLSVYWLGDDNDKRQFGIAFRPCRVNFANQEVVESILLALALAGGMVAEVTREDVQ